MPVFETRTTRVAFFGRFADERTRRNAPLGSFRVRLHENNQEPIYKENGSFAFIGLDPRPTPYSLAISGRTFRSMNLAVSLPTLDPVSVSQDGEDELYLSITAIDAPQNRIAFSSIPFLPTITDGAEVIGPGGFTATLQETIEGENVEFAVLSSVAGLAPGNVLRIVRSDRVLLRPGPHYAFSEPATVLSVRCLENSPSAEPVAGARLLINHVNGVATSTVTIGGTVLHQVVLAGGPVILGPQAAVDANSNDRGEALLDLPAHLPITSLRVQVSHPRYTPITQIVPMTAGAVTRWNPSLTPV